MPMVPRSIIYTHPAHSRMSGIVVAQTLGPTALTLGPGRLLNHGTSGMSRVSHAGTFTVGMIKIPIMQNNMQATMRGSSKHANIVDIVGTVCTMDGASSVTDRLGDSRGKGAIIGPHLRGQGLCLLLAQGPQRIIICRWIVKSQ